MDNTSLTLADAAAAAAAINDTTTQDFLDTSFLDPAIAHEVLDHATTAEIINASIRDAAQAHAEAEAKADGAQALTLEETQQAIDSSSFDTTQAGPSTLPTGETAEPSRPLYPFAKPLRDNTTPCPLDYAFKDRKEFEEWLAGESSWCHYVQRRVTNPTKRAEERAKARERAHEKKLAAMDPDAAAREPPLKKRRRNRTSTVLNKITYTCHHAGKYESQHNTDLPQEKLRMNTKTSVKCGCLSRVVMNEMEDGEVKAAFWWEHNGHDPFGESEDKGPRLPQVVNDWLSVQFSRGKEPEDILKQLNIPEEEKAERIRLASTADLDADPESDEPPVLAYGLQIKYPDLYNRYRKVGPPLRAKKAHSGIAESSGPKKGKKRKVDTTEEVEEKEVVDEQPEPTEAVYLGDGVEDFTFADLDESLHHLEADLQAHADAQAHLLATPGNLEQAPTQISQNDAEQTSVPALNPSLDGVGSTDMSSLNETTVLEAGAEDGIDLESLEEEAFAQMANTIVGTWTG